MNSYTDKDDPLDKQSIFDVYAKTSEGKLIDIEMQLFNKYDIEKRMLFYWSKRYAGQLSVGDKYPELEKAIDTLQYLSQDSEARRLYEARQKYLHDEASMLESAEMAGVKKVRNL